MTNYVEEVSPSLSHLYQVYDSVLINLAKTSLLLPHSFPPCVVPMMQDDDYRLDEDNSGWSRNTTGSKSRTRTSHLTHPGGRASSQVPPQVRQLLLQRSPCSSVLFAFSPRASRACDSDARITLSTAPKEL